MAWRHPGDRPLSEPIVVGIPMCICITLPQLVNSLRPSDTNICAGNTIIIGSDNGLSSGWHQALIWTNAGIRLIGPLETNFNEISIKMLTIFHSNKCIWMGRLRNSGHFVSATMCYELALYSCWARTWSSLCLQMAQIWVNIGPDNGLLPDRDQDITWTNVDF